MSGAALGAALADATGGETVPTVPAVVEALLAPSDDAARALRTERRELLEDGRDVALELRRLVHGDLCGMFDGTNMSDSTITLYGSGFSCLGRCEHSGQRSFPCWALVQPAASMRSPMTVAKALIVRCSRESRTNSDGQSGLSQTIV